MKKIKEYKDKYFIIELKEGGDFDQAKISIFTGRAKTGDWSKHKKGIRFFAKVSGFQDDNAPTRNWGIGSRNKFFDR